MSLRNDLFYICTKPGDDDKTVKKTKVLYGNNDDDCLGSFKKRRKKDELDLTEKALENFLFGRTHIETKNVDLQTETALSDDDRSSSSDEEDVQNGTKLLNKPTKFKAAWYDEEDENVLVKDVAAAYTKAKGKHGQKETSNRLYSQTLRRKFSSVFGTPKWAELKDREADEDDTFFRETTNILQKDPCLPSGFIKYKKLKDVNNETHNEGGLINAVEFHPSATVALVAGINGTASLFQIDGQSNPKIISVNFEKFPIKTAHFTPDGNEIYVSSHLFRHFYIYDMLTGKICKVPFRRSDLEKGCMHKFEMSSQAKMVAFKGRFGNIHVLSTKSRDIIFSLKMNDACTSLTFSRDGQLLYSHGNAGEVYVWDLRSRNCLYRFVDAGCLKGTSIAVSGNNRYLATGSSSGVVNVYDRNALMRNQINNPVPMKVALNLTTTITTMKFNPTSEILAFASDFKENAVRMLHMNSMSVFSNFPIVTTSSSVLSPRRVNCMDFSLNGGYFALGNNRGAAHLYRIGYFGNY